MVFRDVIGVGTATTTRRICCVMFQVCLFLPLLKTLARIVESPVLVVNEIVWCCLSSISAPHLISRLVSGCHSALTPPPPNAYRELIADDGQLRAGGALPARCLGSRSVEACHVCITAGAHCGRCSRSSCGRRGESCGGCCSVCRGSADDGVRAASGECSRRAMRIAGGGFLFCCPGGRCRVRAGGG